MEWFGLIWLSTGKLTRLVKTTMNSVFHNMLEICLVELLASQMGYAPGGSVLGLSVSAVLLVPIS